MPVPSMSPTTMNNNNFGPIARCKAGAAGAEELGTFVVIAAR